MQSTLVNTILVTLLIAVVGLAGTVSMLIYLTLQKKGDTAMTRMKLHSDKTFKEFKALLYSHLIQAIGLFTMGIGAAQGMVIAVQIGRIATIIQGAITITVVYRWWKRFNY